MEGTDVINKSITELLMFSTWRIGFCAFITKARIIQQILLERNHNVISYFLIRWLYVSSGAQFEPCVHLQFLQLPDTKSRKSISSLIGWKQHNQRQGALTKSFWKRGKYLFSPFKNKKKKAKNHPSRTISLGGADHQCISLTQLLWTGNEGLLFLVRHSCGAEIH